MIKPTMMLMRCDGQECESFAIGEDRKHCISLGMERGWTFEQGTGKQYCLAHTRAKKCLECGQYMWPTNRRGSDFPVEWVEQGSATLCRPCLRDTRSGWLGQIINELDQAVHMYYSVAPVQMHTLLKGAEDEEQELLALKYMERVGASDLAETVLG